MSNKSKYINVILIIFLMLFVLDIFYMIFTFLNFSFIYDINISELYSNVVAFILWSYPIIFFCLLFLRNYVSRFIKISYLILLIIKVCLIIIYIKNGGL